MKTFVFVALFVLASTTAMAGNNTVSLSLRDHKFSPAEIHVKANTLTTVSLTNNDDETEEFDSTSLKIEKVVKGHTTGTMRWRPLAPGRYPFMGEFHSDTAQGIVISE